MQEIKIDPDTVMKACHDCGKQGLIQGFIAAVSLMLLVWGIGWLIRRSR
ncbi:MAG: hypothetical protein AAF320_04315 [Myxococcota bacterium]